MIIVDLSDYIAILCPWSISVTECVKNYFLWELLCSRRVEFKWREIRKVNIICLCEGVFFFYSIEIQVFENSIDGFINFISLLSAVFLLVCVFEVVSYNLGHVFYYIRLVLLYFLINNGFYIILRGIIRYITIVLEYRCLEIKNYKKI